MQFKLLLLATASLLSGCGKELPPVPEPESRPAKLFTVSVGNAQFERHLGLVLDENLNECGHCPNFDLISFINMAGDVMVNSNMQSVTDYQVGHFRPL